MKGTKALLLLSLTDNMISVYGYGAGKSLCFFIY